MRYGLARAVLDSSAFTEISHDEFLELCRSRDTLFLLLAIEEQFDLVLGNYIEFETDLLAMATRSMVQMRVNYEYMQRERNLIVNRRFANLLSACRGYLDHTDHHLKVISECGTAPTCHSNFRLHRSQQYDASLGFRTMEAMRNYAQHRGFAVAITYQNRWIRENDDPRMMVAISTYIDTRRLDATFKSKVRQELIAQGERVDMTPLVRDYVGSLSVIHEDLRKELESSGKRCEDVLLRAMGKFKDDHPQERSVGLSAVRQEDSGQYSEKLPIFAEPIEYRKALAAKNSGLGTLAKRFVSSDARVYET